MCLRREPVSPTVNSSHAHSPCFADNNRTFLKPDTCRVSMSAKSPDLYKYSILTPGSVPKFFGPSLAASLFFSLGFELAISCLFSKSNLFSSVDVLEIAPTNSRVSSKTDVFFLPPPGPTVSLSPAAACEVAAPYVCCSTCQLLLGQSGVGAVFFLSAPLCLSPDAACLSPLIFSCEEVPLFL